MNINDYVYVTLTDAGLKRMWRRDDYYSDTEKAGKWQLWRLMQVFGEGCYAGADPMFQGNEVRFADPSAAPPKPRRRG